MSQKSYSDIIRKWSRLLHRDLSFFFAGILMIYAISGFMLNHKKDFNSDYLNPAKTNSVYRANPGESPGNKPGICRKTVKNNRRREPLPETLFP